jgi:serine/threonine protein kinase/HAMP domain-containing protein
MDKSTKPATSQTSALDETFLTELALVDPLFAPMRNAPDEDRTHFGPEINRSHPNENAFARTALLASAAAASDQPPPPDSDRTVPRVVLATLALAPAPAPTRNTAEDATVLLSSQTAMVASLPPTLVTQFVPPPQATDPVPADVPAPITPAAPVSLTPTSLALPLGFRLHEYRIDSVLGQGGFGITYLATDIHLNAKVAIKEYLPEDFANRSSDKSVSPRREEDREFYQNGLDSFLVEARTLATFRHPNIVRVARFFEANASAYMVLEYERGKSLKAWWRNRRELPEEELLALLLPLLDGLAVVHTTGYLHRDIKPDNIYVREEDGSLVLLDFGAALQTAAGSDGMSGVVTPGYGPIEQYENGNQGPWTDIYAIGATLYAMVTGKKPPPAPTRLDAEDPMLPAVDACKGQYSPEFLRAIDWALQPRAEDRPQDIASFTEALFAAHASALNLQAALKAGEGGDEADRRQALIRGPRSVKGKLSRFARNLGQPRSWPMALKMTLAMVLTALMPMLITAYYNLNGSIAVVSTSELRNLEQLAQSTAGRVSQFIKDSRNLAAYLGTDEDFVQFFEAPSDEGKRSIGRKLEELIKANSDVNLVIVMDTLGTALVVGGDQAVIGRNFKFREYFQVAMQGRPYTTGIVVGSVAGGAGVFYSTPVFGADRQVIGVVVMRIKAASIAAMLEEMRQGSQRIPFMIDGDGVIIYHPQPEMLYRSLAPLPQAVSEAIVADQRFRRDRVDSLDMPYLAQAMLGAKTVGNIDYTSVISGQQEIAGFAPVSGHNWVIGVTESRAFFTEPLNALFANVLYSVILVGFVFLFLALLFARTIVKPIRELNDAAHALKAGDYDRAVITVTSRDEIGQLAHTFNVMIDVLRQRERERGGIGRRIATVRKPDRGDPE